MTIQEVIDKILQYHPAIMRYTGCDEFKCGDPSAECTGIVTAMDATVNVVKKAAELGANLIIVHEPTNYTSSDRPGWYEDFKNDVFAEKWKILSDNGIAVWRDHDHLHMHQPDGIFAGVLKNLGWFDYAEVDTSMKMFAHFIVTLPEDRQTTLQALLSQLKNTIGMNGIRYIGPSDMPVRKLALVGHLFPGSMKEKNHGGEFKEYSVEIIRYFEEQGVDVLLPGETIDWTVLNYVRDAVQLGQNKAVVTLGHFNWEEMGMRYAKEWVQDLVGDALTVTYVPTEDMYSYYTE